MITGFVSVNFVENFAPTKNNFMRGQKETTFPQKWKKWAPVYKWRKTEQGGFERFKRQVSSKRQMQRLKDFVTGAPVDFTFGSSKSQDFAVAERRSSKYSDLVLPLDEIRGSAQLVEAARRKKGIEFGYRKEEKKCGRAFYIYYRFVDTDAEEKVDEKTDKGTQQLLSKKTFGYENWTLEKNLDSLTALRDAPEKQQDTGPKDVLRKRYLTSVMAARRDVLDEQKFREAWSARETTDEVTMAYRLELLQAVKTGRVSKEEFYWI